MLHFLNNSSQRMKLLFVLLTIALSFGLATTAGASDKKNKKNNTPASAPGPRTFKFDPTKLVWPSPPNIARVKWLDYYAGMKIDYTVDKKGAQKSSWMDRLAGTQSAADKGVAKNFPFQLIAPNGIAVDSKGLIYVADQKVGAIFIFDQKTHDTTMLRNGYEAKFEWINGLAIDDDDRLFVADCKMRHILVLNPKHAVEGLVTEGLDCPAGLAIDTENRLLYAADTQQDQVLVFDADSFKLLRRIGTGGKNHYLTSVGDFAAPQGVAVDKDGNLYVADTLNNRVEIFDADGAFISWFGKHGDGPGYFARPKGIAVDSDGHIWVADQMTDRLQAFNREGQLLTFIGVGHGELPGQFKALVGVATDKQNRIITSEQEPGRIQIFQYVTDIEAAKDKERAEAEREKAAEEKRHSGAAAPPQTAAPANTPAPAAQTTPAPAEAPK
jgi:sugar lactone lactonase YvrE